MVKSVDHFDGVKQFDADLWRTADDLRADSGLASNESFMPVKEEAARKVYQHVWQQAASGMLSEAA